MLLTKCDCCLVGAIVIVATMFGQSTAQSYSNTTIIILSNSTVHFSRRIIVPRVPVLRFLLPLPEVNRGTDHAYLNGIPFSECDVTGYMCHEVKTQNSSISSFNYIYTLNNQHPEIIAVSIDSRFKAGCRYYMHPQNATLDGNTRPAPINLTCEPIPENSSDFEGTVTTEWRKFHRQEDLEYFIQNCSDFPENCTNSFRDEVLKNNNEYMLSDYSVTIMNPENNQAWFVPSFTVNNSDTFSAPDIVLYRWPRITTQYEFSLEVVEPASNYTGLRCVANSFPPIKTFEWSRGEGREAVNSLSDTGRYIFTNSTADDVDGRVTIIQIVPAEDNALFTCTVAKFGSSFISNVSLSVRLRVKDRFRPLWPAVGIIGVGILVSLFIIIGHFCDIAIEKHKNEPSNPSHHKRLQSITSTMDNEISPNNGPSGKKQSASQANQVKYTIGDHMAVKRLSSARIQLLEEPQ